MNYCISQFLRVSPILGLSMFMAANTASAQTPTAQCLASLSACIFASKNYALSPNEPTAGLIGAITSTQLSLQEPGSTVLGNGPWIRGFGGNFLTRSNTVNVNSPDTLQSKNSTDLAGVQAGWGYIIPVTAGSRFYFGATGGYVRSDTTINSVTNRAANAAFSAATVSLKSNIGFDVPFFGAYAALEVGNFIVDFNIRRELYSGTFYTPGYAAFFSSNTGEERDRLNPVALSLNSSASYRLNIGPFLIDPGASVIYSKTEVGRLTPISSELQNGLAASLRIAEFETFLTRAGARLSIEPVNIANIVDLQPFASASRWFDLSSPVRSGSYNSIGGTSDYLRTLRIGDYTQVGGGLSFSIRGAPLSGVVRVDYRTGNRIEATTASAGIKYEF